MDAHSQILVSVDEGLGRITLNRPSKINALSKEMIDQIFDVLTAWVDDRLVERIELCGAGDRGFCAGADIKALREQIIAGNPGYLRDLLLDEYDMNALIAQYPKPITSYLYGISMGGGLGVGQHVSRRIGNKQTRWAMPETAIGLWPDVGVLYELSRAPGNAGAYLVMTGESIDAASAIWAGFLDEAEGVSDEDVEYCWLAGNASWIDEAFEGNDAALIYERLSCHRQLNARSAAEIIAKRSPLSVCVSLEALRRAEKMSSVAEVLDQDRALAQTMSVDPAEFVEGVRAKMVDKDAPHWRHAHLKDVTAAEVAARFRR